MIGTGGVISLLFREKLLPLLWDVHHKLPSETSFEENGEPKPLERFTELAKESLSWREHIWDWRFHGTPAKNISPRTSDSPSIKSIDEDRFIPYVRDLIQSYSWCLIPWGVDYTGQIDRKSVV